MFKTPNQPARASTDTIPAMLTAGEQVASNGALQLLGREIIPAANKRALAMKTATQTKPKKYANGTMTARGVPGLPRLGKGFDTGNNVPGNTAIPGVNRTGNSYSQAQGFVPTPRQPAPTPSLGGGYIAPVQGFAVGTMSAKGVSDPYYDPDRELKAQQAMQAVPFVSNAQRQPSALDTAYSGLKKGSDALTGYGEQAADNVGRSVAQLEDYFTTPAQAAQPTAAQPSAIEGDYIPAQKQGSPLVRPSYPNSPIANANANVNAVPTKSGQPPQLGVNFTDKGGVSTLSGNNFSVLSRAPGLGAFSTPESLAALDNTIAHNAKPEVRAKYQANADAYYAGEAQKTKDAQLAQLQDIALNGGGNARTMGIGDFVAANQRQKAAQNLLGNAQQLQLGQARLAQDQGQFDANNRNGMAKAQYDYDIEKQKLGLPQYEKLNTYDDLGQINGQQLVGIDRKTGQTKKLQGGDIHSDYADALKQLAQEPDVAIRQKKRAAIRARYDSMLTSSPA